MSTDLRFRAAHNYNVAEAGKIKMNGKRKVALVVILLLAVAAAILGVAYRTQARPQPKLEGFLAQLEEVYRGIRDLEAVVTIVSRQLPEGKEQGASQLKIGALLGQRVLRVEFLNPSEMRGQVYTLKGNVLSQYMPVINLIIIQEITEAHVLYPLLESLNFDLQAIVTRLREKGFSLSLTQEIALPGVEYKFRGVTVGELARARTEVGPGLGPVEGREIQIQLLGLTLSLHISSFLQPLGTWVELELGLGFTLRVGELQVGDYILEAVPPEAVELKGLGWQMERQLIWVDPLTFMPKRLETYLARKVGEKLRQEQLITIIDEIKLNLGLTEKDLLALPRDARILDRRGRS